jgi:hypothetical protein
MRVLLVLAAAVSLVALARAPVGVQAAQRLKGVARTDGGTPVFTGQKDLGVAGADDGEWNLPGLTTGIRVIAARAPDTIPAVIILPVQFDRRRQVGAVGDTIGFQLPLAMEEAPTPTKLAAPALLTLGDWDGAGKSLWAARELVPKDLRPALAAAIGDLQVVSKVG